MNTGYVLRTEFTLLPEPRPSAAPAHRPLLFLHIPKTAGTSLLLALRNMFGDQRVLRIDSTAASDRLTAEMADLVANRLHTFDCLVGHLPMHVVARHIGRFRPFTLLREPVARVFSLYRFLRQASEATLAGMGLRPGFGFDEFIGSRSVGVFEQVNNGMCRMLTDDPRLLDPRHHLFWQVAPETEHGERALAMLERLDFGLVEEMERTLQLLQARWNQPFPIGEYRENYTVQDEPISLAHLQLVIRRNMLDIAVYQRATALFHARADAANADGGEGTAAASLFAPTLDVPAGVGQIPGRQGFHLTEPGSGLAWLRADGPAHIFFAAPAERGRIRLHFYCITEDYPIDRILLQLNGARVAHQARWDSPNWCVLEMEAAFQPGMNDLAIDPPMFISVRQKQPDTRDHRYLSVALAKLIFLS